MDGLQGDVTMVVDESLDCPEYNKDNFQMAEEFSFWVEGVFQVRNIYLTAIDWLRQEELQEVPPKNGYFQIDHWI